MKYKVEITETLQKQIEIEASSKNEALNLIRDKYRNEEIVLNESNFIDVYYSIINEHNKNNKMQQLVNEYPPGTKVKCIHMDDPFHPVPDGTIGKVTSVDDAGTIHVSWETGSTLGLVPGEDQFEKVTKPMKEKNKSYER